MSSFDERKYNIVAKNVGCDIRLGLPLGSCTGQLWANRLASH